LQASWKKEKERVYRRAGKRIMESSFILAGEIQPRKGPELK
jgi:hypothetical protein